ncbi:MAG: tyrosine-protein phosphatase [Saprospiraceae bacterium]
MFNFFKKSPARKADFSFLQTDIHSHLIPGIDDGSKTIEESIDLIRQLMDLGYRKIITTPHIMGEYYPNTPERIETGLVELIKALEKEKIDIEISVAAEYNLDDFFDNLLKENKRLLTFSENHLLVELSTFAPPSNVFDTIFQLKAKGYQPILAHPERYLYYEKDFAKFEKLKEMGCYFQVNLLSLAGHYGKGQKLLGIKLLEKGYVEFLGTDLHRERHIEKISKVYEDRKVAKLLDKLTFRNSEM